MSAFVSVLIPTLNREQVLCETLMYCFDQDYPSYEIVVVDQTDSHEVTTDEFIDSHRDRIKYIKVSTKGLPAARNTCINNAKGEILIFIDDDVVLTRDFISNHVKLYKEHPGISAVAGGILEEPYLEKKDVKVTKRDYLGRPNINYHSENSGYVDAAKGCNMSFLHKVFDSIGGFDEKLPAPYLREDTDFFLRMKKSGLKTFFSSDACLRHLKVPSGGTSELKMSIAKVKNGRDPWSRRESYMCETVFQLKHFSVLVFPVYLGYFIVGWVVLKNKNNFSGFILSAKEMFWGVLDGIKYYMSHY